jgi:hypothetical protein
VSAPREQSQETDKASKILLSVKIFFFDGRAAAERRKMLMLIVDGEKKQKRQARYSR